MEAVLFGIIRDDTLPVPEFKILNNVLKLVLIIEVAVVLLAVLATSVFTYAMALVVVVN